MWAFGVDLPIWRVGGSSSCGLIGGGLALRVRDSLGGMFLEYGRSGWYEVYVLGLAVARLDHEDRASLQW